MTKNASTFVLALHIREKQMYKYITVRRLKSHTVQYYLHLLFLAHFWSFLGVR